MTIYNPNVDLVNDTVYTKFGLNKSIRCQDIEKKKRIPTSVNALGGGGGGGDLRKMMIFKTNVDLINDYVYTKFG